MSLTIHAAARTHRGLRRTNNEDSAYLGRRLFVVADGMGGAEFGEVASALVTHTVAYLDDHLTAMGIEQDLPAAVQFADARLERATAMHPELRGMGSTLTAMLLTGDRIGLAHVGDSRAYLLRNDRVEQVTRDDTYVQLLAERGHLTPEEAAEHPQRNVLIKVLRGDGDGASAQLRIRTAKPGDRYLLCSDGLSDYVAADDIERVLIRVGDPAEATEALVELTLQAGAPDNVTCVVGDVVAADSDSDAAPQFLGAAAELDADAPGPAGEQPGRVTDAA
jgi:PPM family protein phosphatase